MTTAPPPPPKQQWQKKTCSRLRYSGKNFAVDSNGILTADCTFWDADKKEFGTKKSSLDLKEVLGWDSSSPAHFVWSGSDFKNRGFLSSLKPGGKLEISPNGITYVELKAEMADGNEGKYSVATKDLQERIVIVDGELKYVRNGLTLNDGRTMHGSLTDFMTELHPKCEGVIEPTGTLSTGPGDFVHAIQQIAHKDNVLFDTQQYRSEAFVGGSITVKDGQEVTDYQRVLGASVGVTNIPGTQIGTHGTARVDLVDGRVGALSGRLGLGADSGIQTHDKSVRVEFLGTGVTVGRKIGASLFGTGFEIDFGKLW